MKTWEIVMSVVGLVILFCLLVWGIDWSVKKYNNFTDSNYRRGEAHADELWNSLEQGEPLPEHKSLVAKVRNPETGEEYTIRDYGRITFRYRDWEIRLAPDVEKIYKINIWNGRYKIILKKQTTP